MFGRKKSKCVGVCIDTGVLYSCEGERQAYIDRIKYLEWENETLIKYISQQGELEFKKEIG